MRCTTSDLARALGVFAVGEPYIADFVAIVLISKDVPPTNRRWPKFYHLTSPHTDTHSSGYGGLKKNPFRQSMNFKTSFVTLTCTPHRQALAPPLTRRVARMIHNTADRDCLPAHEKRTEKEKKTAPEKTTKMEPNKLVVTFCGVSGSSSAVSE